jgi:hypothetical protein
VLAVPCVLFSWFGFGRWLAMGTQIVRPYNKVGTLSMSELLSVSSDYRVNHDYFTTYDGFIAYNLSKSVVRTLKPHDMRVTDSLFFGAENPVVAAIFGSTNFTYYNPYISEINLFDSTQQQVIYEDVISQWTIAPVFSNSHPCLYAPPPIHITCILSNPIIAWAMSTDTSSACRLLGSSSCTLGGINNQSLSIYYPDQFNFSFPVKLGTSGILTTSPPPDILEAFQARFIADGWPFNLDTQGYPAGMPSVFLEVIPNISQIMNDIESQSLICLYVGIFFFGLGLFCVLYPMYLDIKTDLTVLRLIKQQKMFLHETEIRNAQRAERRRLVANITGNEEIQ